MDKNALYLIDENIYKKIQEEKKMKETEIKAYFEGMEKGAEMVTNAVRDYLNTEQLVEVQSDEKVY